MASSLPSILQKIVAQRHERIDSIYQQEAVQQIQAALTPSTRSLAQALAQPRASFILECKKASPSQGLIRADFDPVAIAQAYEPYADAISVLTEPDFFQGSYTHLAAVAAAVNKPVLCKDFIVDPVQIIMARHHGADAILLMLSILTDDEYQQLATFAATYNLDVLTEVANEDELQRAINLNANIVGINNRDLHTLKVDTQRSIDLAQRLPPTTLVVAESGYQEHQQVRAAANFVHGFLIGTALTKQSNLDQACRELIYGKHKICGLTQVTAAQSARAAGAAYGGLIFVEHSPRQVTIAAAHKIMSEVPELNYIGVFADTPMTEVATIATQLGLTAIQLHGYASKLVIEQLRQLLPADIQIWRAIDASASVQLPALPVEAFLLDNGNGGSGRSFDWDRLNTLTAQQRSQCILAGGLSLSNVDSALATGMLRCDFNSGVESSPGLKDPQKISQLMNHIRAYGRKPQGVPHA